MSNVLRKAPPASVIEAGELARRRNQSRKDKRASAALILSTPGAGGSGRKAKARSSQTYTEEVIVANYDVSHGPDTKAANARTYWNGNRAVNVLDDGKLDRAGFTWRVESVRVEVEGCLTISQREGMVDVILSRGSVPAVSSYRDFEGWVHSKAPSPGDIWKRTIPFRKGDSRVSGGVLNVGVGITIAVPEDVNEVHYKVRVYVKVAYSKVVGKRL